jgi:hypothetical protein
MGSQSRLTHLCRISILGVQYKWGSQGEGVDIETTGLKSGEQHTRRGMPIIFELMTRLRSEARAYLDERVSTE